ncbi:hypothetical protein E2C01_011987 [Portunus trituberculatus]|uniref:Uncharacterized protein n=1 Tax=Portunus trituberculatus TaxID=210409 RepID=A0A5B7DCI4_PORTR|nr:hypothetical protein [Portunus trituberculatus]
MCYKKPRADTGVTPRHQAHHSSLIIITTINTVDEEMPNKQCGASYPGAQGAWRGATGQTRLAPTARHPLTLSMPFSLQSNTQTKKERAITSTISSPRRQSVTIDT